MQPMKASIQATLYGAHVRTRTVYDKDRSEDMEIVEVLTDGKWGIHQRFGHMSNDYALHDARVAAQALARRFTGQH